MLNDNIRNLRKSMGISQEELAIKLNVVRQTVSKWENGLSVPDSEILIRIAEELDTTVNVLLGEEVPVSEESELKTIAAKLELLNEQFAKRSESRRKIWRTVFIVACAITVIALLVEFASVIHYFSVMDAMHEDIAIIGGADVPTNVYISSVSIRTASLIATIAVGIIGVIGLFKTRKNK